MRRPSCCWCWCWNSYRYDGLVAEKQLLRSIHGGRLEIVPILYAITIAIAIAITISLPIPSQLSPSPSPSPSKLNCSPHHKQNQRKPGISKPPFPVIAGIFFPSAFLPKPAVTVPGPVWVAESERRSKEDRPYGKGREGRYFDGIPSRGKCKERCMG